MLERLHKLYIATLRGQVWDLTPHIVGPPGSAKSTLIMLLGRMLGVTVHTINVSRLSILEVEGVQMPVDENTRLHMLPATYWTRLKEGDIILFDEFLRGFPETYNGLLDIFTSRQVGDYKLPPVFIIAASNSVTTYDDALEDRLLHIPVPDPRHNKGQFKQITEVICSGIGLLPSMAESSEMEDLMNTEVLPKYAMLDAFKKGASMAAADIKGTSPRKLISQAKLREVQSKQLKNLLASNNMYAMQQGKAQYVVLESGVNPNPKYVHEAKGLLGNPRLTAIQAYNLEMNLELIELEETKKEEMHGQP